MNIRRLRRWIRVTNAILAVGIIAVAGVVAIRQTAPERLMEPARFDSTLRVPTGNAVPSTVSEAEFKQMAASLGGSRSPERARVVRPAEAEDPEGLLPLRLFQVAGLSHDPRRGDVVGLRSKDPARPEAFALGRDEVVHGVRLVSVERGSGPARITVARGTERFTFTFIRASDGTAISIVLPGHGASRTGPSRPGSSAIASRPSSPESTGLRLVAFLGADGLASGVRVAGIAPASSFAAAGVRRGDAILEFDGNRISSAAEFSKQWNEGWRPKEALVLALDQPGAKPTRIKFGS